MRIINTAKDNPALLNTLGRLALYSGMDNLTLFEIRDGLAELMDEKRWATYEFELELQAALLEMSLNGIHVDQQARSKMQAELSKDLKALTSLLNEMLDSIGYFEYYIQMAVHEFSIASGIPMAELPQTWDEWKSMSIGWRREAKQAAPQELKGFHLALKNRDIFNPNSSQQKLKLFYHFFGRPDNTIAAPFFYPPPWLKTYGVKEHKGRKSDGTYGPTTDRDAMEKIIKNHSEGPAYAAFWAAPFAKVCLDIADATKSLQFLNCKLENGMFRSSFGVTTETGRLASRKNAMGFGWNAQNVTPKLRIIFTVPRKWKLAAPDYEQIESRNVGAICYTRFGADAYLNASECGDLHTLVCSMVWTDKPWPADLTIDHLRKHGPFPKDLIKAAKKIAAEPFYRHFSYRDAVKRLGHGSNYLGQPKHMAAQTHILIKLIEQFQDAYFDAFPEIKWWHNWVAEQLQIEGEITTLFGRARRFFSRPNEEKTVREAVAYEPQSMGADYTNKALLRVYKAHRAGLPVELFLQKHDEIGFRYLEKDEDIVIPIVRDLMEHRIMLTAPDGQQREWYVPTEFESGWNLGRANDKNPDGLSHVDSTRVRQKAKKWNQFIL